MSNVVVLRTVYALNSNTGQFLDPGLSLVTNGTGGTNWLSANDSLIITGGDVMNDLPSTISTVKSHTLQIAQLSNDLYPGLSSLSVAISLTAGTISLSNLTSTVGGLGSSGYTSTATVSNIVNHILDTGTVTNNYITQLNPVTSNIVNNILTTGTVTNNYITQLNPITSNVVNNILNTGTLTSNYIEQITTVTSNILNTGPITSNYTSQITNIVDGGLTSTVAGLGQTYLSSALLTSTVKGLGSSGYLSTSQLTSSLTGLGSLGYISSQQLISTVQGINNTKANIRFDTTTSVTTIDSINYFANAGTVIYISTFFQSSIYYSGNNIQTMQGIKAGTHDMFFSTASMNLSPFSTFINTSSIVSFDIYPTIAFSKLGTGATSPAMLPISSFLQAGTTPLYGTTTTSWLYAGNTRILLENGSYADSSNIFNQPIKMIVPKNTFLPSTFTSTFSLVHYMPSSLNNGALQNALHNSTIIPFFTSTNSVYISIQNLV